MSVVRIVIKTLPELSHNAQYRWVFGNATPIYANVTQEGLLCTISPVNERPTIGDGLDHMLVPMSVRSSEAIKDFVSRSLVFYDCSRHDSCRKFLTLLRSTGRAPELFSGEGGEVSGRAWSSSLASTGTSGEVSVGGVSRQEQTSSSESQSNEQEW
uniref:Plexin TIG domain-containing protein n=2 Tax=Anopheles atroparvus TaxID=41427 RepID=A0A182J1X5_ANOAO